MVIQFVDGMECRVEEQVELFDDLLIVIAEVFLEDIVGFHDLIAAILDGVLLVVDVIDLDLLIHIEGEVILSNKFEEVLEQILHFFKECFQREYNTVPCFIPLICEDGADVGWLHSCRK